MLASISIYSSHKPGSCAGSRSALYSLLTWTSHCGNGTSIPFSNKKFQVPVPNDTRIRPQVSCKMSNDTMAVEDSNRKLHGMGSFLIADASIIPELIPGNTIAPTFMIGEKCADAILHR